MGIPQSQMETVSVRLATSEAEIHAAQRLRYKVFYEEYSATPDEDMQREKRDMDAFDDISDHLVVIDESITDPEEQIVGTYRLLRNEVANKHGAFYTSDEYDIQPLQQKGQNLLELGRSCVLADYRTRPVMQLLWQGLTNYMWANDANVLFGCASLYGTDIDQLSEQLAYLHHYHLAPEAMRPKALSSRYVDMDLHAKDDLDVRRIFRELPPLIKGYVRVGCMIGEGAVMDHQFNTTDVCIILPISQMAARYRKHYERKAGDSALNGKKLVGSSLNSSATATGTDTKKEKELVSTMA